MTAARTSIFPAWEARAKPLTACAAAAVGPSACALVSRLLEADDSVLSQLTGVASSRVVLVLGPTEALPWVEGIAYLGRAPEAPSLLLPCAVSTHAPARWVARAVALHVAERAPALASEGSWAILRDPLLLLPLSGALRVQRSALLSWQSLHAPAVPEGTG